MNNIKEFNGADFGDFLLKSNLVDTGKEKFMVDGVVKILHLLHCNKFHYYYDVP